VKKEENKKVNGNSGAPNSRDDAHLSDEEIIAYQYGNLPSPKIEQQAQNHLIECRQCTNLLLELNAFTESAADSNLQNVENFDSQRAKFEKKTAVESKVTNQKIAEPKPAPAAKKNFFGFLSFNFARLATAAFLVVLTFGAIVFVLQNKENNQSEIAQKTEPVGGQTEPVSPPGAKNESTVDEPQNKNENTFAPENFGNQTLNRGGQKTLPSPTVPKNNFKNQTPRQSPPLEKELALNTVDFELYPRETLRGGDDVRKILVKQNAERIRLKLKAPSSKSFSKFRIEIADAQEKVVLTQPVTITKRGDFVLNIPLKNLPAKVYSLKIYGAQNNAQKLFAEYDFKVEYK